MMHYWIYSFHNLVFFLDYLLPLPYMGNRSLGYMALGAVKFCSFSYSMCIKYDTLYLALWYCMYINHTCIDNTTSAPSGANQYESAATARPEPALW